MDSRRNTLSIWQQSCHTLHVYMHTYIFSITHYTFLTTYPIMTVWQITQIKYWKSTSDQRGLASSKGENFCPHLRGIELRSCTRTPNHLHHAVAALSLMGTSESNLKTLAPSEGSGSELTAVFIPPTHCKIHRVDSLQFFIRSKNGYC